MEGCQRQACYDLVAECVSGVSVTDLLRKVVKEKGCVERGWLRRGILMGLKG